MRTQLWPVTLVSLALFAAAMARGQSMPASPPTSASPPAPTASATTSYDAVSIHEHAADDHSMMWRILPNGFNNANVHPQQHRLRCLQHQVGPHLRRPPMGLQQGF